jgi:hypothetical protein
MINQQKKLGVFGKISLVSVVFSIGLATLLFLIGGIIEVIKGSGYIHEYMLWFYKTMDILILLSVASIANFYIFLIYKTINVRTKLAK